MEAEGDSIIGYGSAGCMQAYCLSTLDGARLVGLRRPSSPENQCSARALDLITFPDQQPTNRARKRTFGGEANDVLRHARRKPTIFEPLKPRL